MKILLGVVALLASLSIPSVANAADISGTWKGNFQLNGNDTPTTMTLKSEGDTVTGTVQVLPNSAFEIHDGKLDGGSVWFWVNADYEGQTYKVVYKGKIGADEIDFDFGTEDGSWATSMAVKKEGAEPAAKPVEVTGAWKGSFDLNGSPMPLVFHLKSDGTTVTGTMEGTGVPSAEIHDGKIVGNLVTFWLNADYGGQTYVLSYKGTVDGDKIDFSFGTADGSWGAQITVKKS